MLVGFALEDRDLRANAERKMREKNLDMIVANTPQAISAERSTVHIRGQETEWIEIGGMAKSDIAARIVRLIERAKNDQ